MGKMKGAEIIAEFLAKEEVPYIFGICGHGNVGILDTLYDYQDKIKLISPRHEQVAGHMADAYFRVAHKPVATLTSCGPGSANIVMATACAQADSSAFLAITANVPTSQFNRGPFQESYQHFQGDFPSVMRPYVKRSFQPSRPEMLPLALRQSMNLMVSGRPGPVHLDVPYDVFQEEADVTVTRSDAKGTTIRSGVARETIAEIADLVARAERPVLFVGHGVTLSEASADLTQLVERFAIPVISSPNGMGTLDMYHPLSLGFIGRNGAYPANQAGRHADLVIAVGARFDDRSSSTWIQGYSWNFPATKLVHIDIDPAEIGRNYPVTIGATADARTFLRQLVEELAGRGAFDANSRFAQWRKAIAGWQREWQDFLKPDETESTSPVRPETIVADLQRILPADTILSLDSGQHHNWFMQFWKARHPQAMLNSWGFSAMGFGVCGVLGAALAAPGRPHVAVVGDGGFTMAPHVLCTAVEYDIPAIWIVWNNFAWGAIRDLQHGLFDGREIGTAFHHGSNKDAYNPDFAAMARSCGVEGLTVKHEDELGSAVQHALRLGKPCLIDVHVRSDIKPPSTGTWQLPPLQHREPVFGSRVLF
ncbi:thiamine pyrophosphate-binding protein [Aestuariivirga sp. YIM B02566]|uniref:Thiamine pyrophosphate-binding protein n=1 Tax=Taklimakanibacter albus TaxID=2800327 RepID=A0ACC5R3J7_9HYPH|nr:thiamine pyrophosphate-binding protein [Aestuariivirga sp. YIM B02566]